MTAVVTALILLCGAATSPRRRRRIAAAFAARRLRRRARRRAGLVGEYCAGIARRLHAGETLLQAMTAGATGSAAGDARPLREPISRLLDEHARGVTLARAAQRWATRDATEETALLSIAVSLASEQVGADPALFDRVAQTIGARNDLVADARVQVAQARASIWVVASLPWAIAVVLLAEGGTAADVLLHTPLGWFSVAAAALMELAGIAWMRGLIERAVP
ncbi:MAG TPA: hypothetical protein DEP66_06200 [Acidimicrobiaceae bacterium]|nr:hypothetical protein [Acidimicrobiaceae bacterium]HCB37781.1 hypothetical protein [Acidimicrobiaceae bacterium]